MRKLLGISIGLTALCLTLLIISLNRAPDTPPPALTGPPGGQGMQAEAAGTEVQQAGDISEPPPAFDGSRRGHSASLQAAGRRERHRPMPPAIAEAPAEIGQPPGQVWATAEEAAAEEAAAPVTAGAEPPMLALTFDDGPGAETTPLLLAGLRERGVHVTFFMLGMLAKRMPEIVLQAYEDGHAIGGHSYNHRGYFTKLSDSALQTQLQNTDDVIAGITGDEPPLLLRPPYGAIDEETAPKTGKAIILWNIDPRDWEARDAQKVYDFLTQRAVDGGVAVLHDIYPTTVEGVLNAIDALLAAGWKIVTVPELYEAKGVTLQPGGIYRCPWAYSLPDDIR